MARILIIDDDDTVRQTLEQWLTAAGHVVIGAANGLEGVQSFHADPTELVLMDLLMSHYGLIAIRALHEQHPGVKVIAMTSGAPSGLDYARRLGACAVLAKPIATDQLAKALAEALAPRDSR